MYIHYIFMYSISFFKQFQMLAIAYRIEVKPRKDLAIQAGL